MEIEYIERLKICIEETIGKKLKTPKDFTNLSEQIFTRLHIMLSPTTLKRLWGYLNEDKRPRMSTLSIISQFAGYRDWELTFLVVDSINSKLEKGDTFQCSIFIEGEPLYLDKLKHKRYTDVSYIAGKNEGIRFEIL